jgi:hypothetical protein
MEPEEKNRAHKARVLVQVDDLHTGLALRRNGNSSVGEMAIVFILILAVESGQAKDKSKCKESSG